MPENNRKMQTDISELENGQLAEQQLPSDFTLVVLAGGASSHMGREKSDLLLDGQTFLEIQIGKGCQLGANSRTWVHGYRDEHGTDRSIESTICRNYRTYSCSRLGNSGRYERSLCFSGIRCIRLSQRSNHSGGWRVSRKIA